MNHKAWTFFWKQQVESIEKFLSFDSATASAFTPVFIIAKKFAIYAHNKNYEKADKTYKKLQKGMQEVMALLDNDIGEGLITEAFYLKTCNHLKALHDKYEADKRYYDARGIGWGVEGIDY